MSTSATEDRTTRARELGLPTNVEEATQNSGNEDNPSLPAGPDSQRQEVERWYVPDASRVIIKIAVEVYQPTSHHAWSRSLGDIPTRCLFETEKQAINASRAIALVEEQRWRDRVNALDERYDKLEDEELALALEKRRINDPD